MQIELFGRGLRLGVIALLVSRALCAADDLIPSEPDGTPRLGHWRPGSDVGVPGGMRLKRSHLIDVTQPPYNADSTGAADCHAALQAAINAAHSGDVVFLPPGQYSVSASVMARIGKSAYTIRGCGDRTLIRWSGRTGECFFLGTDADYNWPYPSPAGIVITADAAQQSHTISVATTQGVFDGALVQIREGNDPDLPVLHVSGFPSVRRQLQLVVAHSRHSVTLYPGLIWPVRSALHAVLHVAQRQSNGVGIENLCIDQDETAHASYILFLQQCYGCWLYNVHTRHARNYHIWMEDCLQCTVDHCFFDTLNHSGMNGAGLNIFGACACLFENNVITHSFPNIELNTGASGNAFLYNFCWDSSTGGASGASIDACHAPHTCYNLFEGNAAPIFEADAFFGSSSENAAFANWWYGRQPGERAVRQPVIVNRFSRNYTLVRNLFGSAGYPYYHNLPPDLMPNGGPTAIGLPNIGNTAHIGIAQLSHCVPWSDWLLTGRVTSTSTVTLTRPSTDLHVGMSQIALTWGAHEIVSGARIETLDGLRVGLHFSGVVRPPIGAVIELWPGPEGFQEYDRDVSATLFSAVNFDVFAGGPPKPVSDTSWPASLAFTARPSWFGNLARWPAFDGANPDPDIVRGTTDSRGEMVGFSDIPAGYRFTHGGIDPDGVSLFTSSPGDVKALAGSMAEFAVAAEGSPDFQWQVSSDGGATWQNLSNGPGLGASFSGVRSPVLYLTNISPIANGGKYRCSAKVVSPRRFSVSQSGKLIVVNR